MSLGATGGAAAADALISVLKDSSEESYVRQGAAEALAKIENNKAISALVTSLADENQDVADKAAELLMTVGEQASAVG